MHVMKPSISIPSLLATVTVSALLTFSSQAQLVFTSGTQIATGGQPTVNNLIDLSLADFANNSTTGLTGYTATNGNNISGSITRSNLTQGSLLNLADFQSVITSSQGANLLSGSVNFSSGTGSITGNSFQATNSTGTITFTSNIAFASSNVQGRTFGTDPLSNSGSPAFTSTPAPSGQNQNSAPISGQNFLNINSTTWTLNTTVDAIGFTALQRDGGRTYEWSVRITDGVITQTISLGSITYTGMSAGTVAGDVNAGNYRYDTFVGYQAPTGFKIDQLILGGGFMNVDSFAYAVIPEPSTWALLALGLTALVVFRRRRTV